MRDIRESDLIAASKRGDQAALTELFKQHYPSSLRVARSILRSEEEAQDAVQSAYLAAFRNLHHFRAEAAFKTWITRIVTNQCLMRLRQGVHRGNWFSLDSLIGEVGSFMPACQGLTPEKHTFCREVAAALRDAAAKLPRRLCEVFHLYAFSGLSVKEVAEVTGLTVSATKTRLFRAQAQMRDHLQPVWSNARLSNGAAQQSEAA